jgi:hypothetical protein
MIKWLSKILHIHFYIKPIASQYVSFGGRNIIYECRCGKRRIEYVRKAYGDPFPIKTNILITDNEMQSILKENNL